MLSVDIPHDFIYKNFFKNLPTYNCHFWLAGFGSEKNLKLLKSTHHYSLLELTHPILLHKSTQPISLLKSTHPILNNTSTHPNPHLVRHL